MRVRWTEPAAKALEDIQDQIAQDNRRAAFEVAQRIRVMTDFLGDHPKIGRIGRVAGTYELVIPGIPYIVPYRIQNHEVQILSVFHTSRKWPESFIH